MLSSSYCNALFIVGLLRHDVFRRLVAIRYMGEGNSNKQNRFDQSKISDYGHQYVEELK